jgi:hypothetical protein
MSSSVSPRRVRPGSALLAAVGAVVLALVAAACSSGHTSAAASHSMSPMPEKSSMPMASASPSMSMGGGMLPMGARHMHVTIVSPMAGMKVTGNSITVHVRVSGYKDTCSLAGKHVMAMEATSTGHYHVLLDGALVNMFCTPNAVVSLQNVKPGMHTLTVVPATDDHAQVTPNARSITFDYAPTSPLPAIKGAMMMHKPSITIVSPKPGATVKGSFTVRVQIKNYRASCALFGKPNLDGYGHWHLNLDAATGGMMGMGAMMGMSCTNTIRASTAGLMPGSTHTLIALLVDNQHVPLMPLVASRVTVRIGK